MAFSANDMSPADIAAVTGGNGNSMFGGDGFLWIIVLFLILAMGGNTWCNNGGGGGASAPYVITNDVQRGFDQSAVINGLSGISTAVTSGFSNAEVNECNRQMTTMQGLNTVQSTIADSGFNTAMAITNATNSLNNTIMQNEMARQACCCDNRAAIADLKYTIATEACADRSAISDALRDVIAANTASTQAILDKMCQQEIDSLKTQNANLQTQINLANLAASQAAQTGKILADNAAQTVALEQYLSPTPVPAYIVSSPYCCNQGQGFGCGYMA